LRIYPIGVAKHKHNDSIAVEVREAKIAANPPLRILIL
jgi:hypothetical protein